MGWEMIRAGAITKLVLDDLETMGCDTKTGFPNSDIGDAALKAFARHSLADHCAEGVFNLTFFFNLSC